MISDNLLPVDAISGFVTGTEKHNSTQMKTHIVIIVANRSKEQSEQIYKHYIYSLKIVHTSAESRSLHCARIKY